MLNYLSCIFCFRFKNNLSLLFIHENTLKIETQHVYTQTILTALFLMATGKKQKNIAGNVFHRFQHIS